MIQKSKLIETVLEYLKHQKVLSALEKDILSTVNTYNEIPFDRKGAEQKITENNKNHPDIFLLIRSTPGIVNKPFSKVSDNEVKDNLYMQIETMCIKEQALIAGKWCGTNTKYGVWRLFLYLIRGRKKSCVY